MKLNYRGDHYEASFSPVDQVESEITGKYRGQSVQFRYPRHIPVPQTYSLKYRDVCYSNTEPKQSLNEVTPFTPTEKQPVERQGATLRLTTFEQAPDENLAKVHTDHLCRLLERRRQAAAARGDLNLLRLLDLEAKQIAC